MSPYVGMARKQNGGYNASISVQTLIFHLVVNSTRLKTVRSALWRCPKSTVALRLLENVVTFFCVRLLARLIILGLPKQCQRIPTSLLYWVKIRLYAQKDQGAQYFVLSTHYYCCSHSFLVNVWKCPCYPMQ